MYLPLPPPDGEAGGLPPLLSLPSLPCAAPNGARAPEYRLRQRRPRRLPLRPPRLQRELPRLCWPAQTKHDPADELFDNIELTHNTRHSTSPLPHTGMDQVRTISTTAPP